MRTLVGMVTYGCLPFTKRAVKSLDGLESFFLVVGDPTDKKTDRWAQKGGFDYCGLSVDLENVGFPADVNQIFDQAFVKGHYGAVILCGNDIEAHGFCIHRLNNCGKSTGSVVCAQNVDEFEDIKLTYLVEGSDKDIFNCALFPRSAFKAVGYLDANFWPGGYFSDNDYARRLKLAGVPIRMLVGAEYRHEVSATKKAGTGTTDRQFERNRNYYIQKWGGPPGEETRHSKSLIRIASRKNDAAIAAFWRRRA